MVMAKRVTAVWWMVMAERVIMSGCWGPSMVNGQESHGGLVIGNDSEL